ncbi:MAG: hypothetical protein ACRDVL_01705 [Acidimicrobiia bacterium]
MEPMPITEMPAGESTGVEDPSVDPVAYLRSLGIEAELMAVVKAPMAPAA